MPRTRMSALQGYFAPPMRRIADGSQPAVLLVGHRLQPFVGSVLSGYFHRDVRKPRVLFRAVPVLDFGGDLHHVAGFQRTRSLAPLLIPPLSGCAQQQLSAALRRVMDVPVVAAARLERDVCISRLAVARSCQRIEIGPADEELRVSRVLRSESEYVFALKFLIIRIYTSDDSFISARPRRDAPRRRCCFAVIPAGPLRSSAR